MWCQSRVGLNLRHFTSGLCRGVQLLVIEEVGCTANSRHSLYHHLGPHPITGKGLSVPPPCCTLSHADID